MATTRRTELRSPQPEKRSSGSANARYDADRAALREVGQAHAGTTGQEPTREGQPTPDQVIAFRFAVFDECSVPQRAVQGRVGCAAGNQLFQA